MDPADDIEEADPGLARERTQLAWTRTTISFAALGGVILKTSPVVGFSVLVVSIVIWEVGRLPRTADIRRIEARLRLITATITNIALAILALTILHW